MLTLSQVGQIPFLDRLFYKNPILLWMSKLGLANSNTPVVQFARKCIAGRSTQHSPNLAEKGQAGRPARRDFYSRFVEARKQDPEFISEQRVLALTVANMFAGSDVSGQIENSTREARSYCMGILSFAASKGLLPPTHINIS